MREIDRTDLAMYLRVMAHAAKHEETSSGADAPPFPKGKAKGQVIELKRGYIDDFF